MHQQASASVSAYSGTRPIGTDPTRGPLPSEFRKRSAASPTSLPADAGQRDPSNARNGDPSVSCVGQPDDDSTSLLNLTDQGLRQRCARLQRALQRQSAELDRLRKDAHIEARMSGIGFMAAGLCHDILNLLLPVRSHLDSLRRFTSQENLSSELDAIRLCVDYLTKLCTGLRLLAIDPTPAPAQSLEAIALNDWQSDIKPFLKIVLPQSIDLKTQIEPDLPPVRANRIGLTQAVFNLVHNAGQVLRGRTGACVSISGSPGAQRKTVRLLVSDNGPGMTEEVRRHCLEPFYTSDRSGRSTGFGLALVRDFVQHCQGRIDVRSTLGAGSTIMLTLPVAR